MNFMISILKISIKKINYLLSKIPHDMKMFNKFGQPVL